MMDTPLRTSEIRKEKIVMWKKFCAALLLMLLLPACALAEVVISEIMTSNGTYESGHAYDWIELHNTGKSTVDISGWYLSDSKKNKMKFQFPQGTKLKADGYLTVFCTGDDEVDVGKGSEFYATFALSSSGESIYLSDADGNQLQKLKYPQQYGCVSYGTTDDGATYGFFENATRGKKNDTTIYSGRVDAPVLDTAGGFYTDSVIVMAHSVLSGATLRYTTDGSTPTAKSKEFPAGGLTIKETTVVRIRAFQPEFVPSPTVSAT